MDQKKPNSFDVIDFFKRLVGASREGDAKSNE
jgi:hypothetical protein